MVIFKLTRLCCLLLAVILLFTVTDFCGVTTYFEKENIVNVVCDKSIEFHTTRTKSSEYCN